MELGIYFILSTVYKCTIFSLPHLKNQLYKGEISKNYTFVWVQFLRGNIEEKIFKDVLLKSHLTRKAETNMEAFSDSVD